MSRFKPREKVKDLPTFQREYTTRSAAKRAADQLIEAKATVLDPWVLPKGDSFILVWKGRDIFGAGKTEKLK